MSEKKTILIIDDEPDTTTYYSALLEDNGYDTIIAENGEEGLEKLKEKTPDLITLDISMPEMSGLKFYRSLKENDAFKNIPVVIITGISKDFEKFITTRKKVLPPEGYISKPIERDKVLKLIGELIQQ
ncbi:MAG: response regulator [Candidatus Electryonea clarkiae]|nr:response regulator [Candidatus Electryonea clarkiae]MDP8285467.1 response regulator [Candidatus Electryonea clarkiae]